MRKWEAGMRKSGSWEGEAGKLGRSQERIKLVSS